MRRRHQHPLDEVAASPRTRRSALLPPRLSAERTRQRIQAAADAAAMATAVLLATVLRGDPVLGDDLLAVLAFAALAAAVLVAVGAARGLYATRWSFGSFEELATLASAVLGATAVSLVLDLALGRPVPLAVPLIASALALVASATVRGGWRRHRERALRPSRTDLERVVVVGAGEGGQQIVTAMLRNPDGRYLPVALLDDDAAKRNLHIRGVPVLGSPADLAAVAADVHATVALLAVPSAGSPFVREVERRAAAAGLRFLVLPSAGELYGAEADTGDIRAVTPADLLGRHEHDTDVEAIAGYLGGKRVLVTGAGGSIGAELCRQIHRYAPASLVLLERDESSLHAVQLALEGRALLDDPSLVVADIRDRPRIRAVFAEHRPEVVFHAAALKHLPLLELHPTEALKTNVWGTVHLLEAAAAVGVERFVNISTDKAADPTSVLGCTKRLAERLTADTAAVTEGAFLSVRFGNVLGSRGSVLTAFAAQIAAGGPVTVTHPDVTRFFMTVEEAVQLVIQAGAVGRDGEALILDMGTPVRIDDVARRLIADAERPVSIVYTGLRTGEKLHEVLVSSGEEPVEAIRPGISHVVVPPLARHQVPPADAPEGPALRDALLAACSLPGERRSAEAPVTEPTPLADPAA